MFLTVPSVDIRMAVIEVVRDVFSRSRHGVYVVAGTEKSNWIHAGSTVWRALSPDSILKPPLLGAVESGAHLGGLASARTICEG
jgi:hypothetical protein